MFSSNNKINSLNIFILYLIYLLPFFLGLGAFIPNLFYTIIFLVFVFYFFNQNIKIKDFNNNFIKLILLFWLISVFSSIFSVNKTSSLISSISFLRFITFAILSYWLIKKKLINFNIFFKIIIYSLSIIIFFSYFELITGYNIILDNISNIITEGFKKPNTRITSLFGDEQVLGGYLLRIVLFSLIIFFSLENELKKSLKLYYLFIILSSLIFIILSGERSSIFMSIFSILLVLVVIKNYKNIKIYCSVFFVGVFLILIFFRPDLYNRLIQQTFKLQIYSAEKKTIHLFSSTHEQHIKTAINIFLDSPIIGSGNKSFRYLCDKDKYTKNIKKIRSGARKGESIGCANHPHNYYFQVLSENGIINFLLLTFFYFYLLKKILMHMYFKFIKRKNYLNNMEVSIYLFYFVLLWPIVPTGSIFSSWIASTLFLPMGFLIHNYANKK